MDAAREMEKLWRQDMGRDKITPSGCPWPYQCLHEWEDGREQERPTSEVLAVLKWTRWRMWSCKKTADNYFLQALLPQIALRPRQGRWECFDFTAALSWLESSTGSMGWLRLKRFYAEWLQFLAKALSGSGYMGSLYRLCHLDGPKTLPVAGLEPGSTDFKTSCSINCAIGLFLEQSYLLCSSTVKAST
jgi:hypothetical protein